MKTRQEWLAQALKDIGGMAEFLRAKHPEDYHDIGNLMSIVRGAATDLLTPGTTFDSRDAITMASALAQLVAEMAYQDEQRRQAGN